MPTRFTFSPNQKIRTTKEYKYLFDHGRRQYNANFRIHFILDAGSITKIGIIITRKIKGAVIRNRYKRLLREFARAIYPGLRPGTLLVIILTKTIEPELITIRDSLSTLLKTAKIS